MIIFTLNRRYLRYAAAVCGCASELKNKACNLVSSLTMKKLLKLIIAYNYLDHE